MEELFDNVKCLANVIWSTATSVKNERLDDEEVFLEVRNKIEEIFISAIFSYDGLHIQTEHFYNGLLVSMASRSGISYLDLVDFLDEVFTVDRTGQPFVLPIPKTISRYDDFVGEPKTLKGFTGRAVCSFSEYVEDLEIDQILEEMPEIVLHEKNVA